MAKKFNLKKGERFNIDKGLSKLQVDLTWKSPENLVCDLDATAFLLNDDGTISEDADFVYYLSNNRSESYDRQKFGSKANWRDETIPVSFDGSVTGAPDDKDGGDGETMHVVISKIRPGVTEIVFCVTIYTPGVTFKDVKNPRIVITDEETGQELCSYALDENFSTETAVVAGALVLDSEGEWTFEAIGKGFDGGLQTLVDMYA